VTGWQWQRVGGERKRNKKAQSASDASVSVPSRGLLGWTGGAAAGGGGGAGGLLATGLACFVCCFSALQGQWPSTDRS